MGIIENGSTLPDRPLWIVCVFLDDDDEESLSVWAGEDLSGEAVTTDKLVGDIRTVADFIERYGLVAPINETL